jgi:hypothetical protein
MFVDTCCYIVFLYWVVWFKTQKRIQNLLKLFWENIWNKKEKGKVFPLSLSQFLAYWPWWTARSLFPLSSLWPAQFSPAAQLHTRRTNRRSHAGALLLSPHLALGRPSLAQVHPSLSPFGWQLGPTYRLSPTSSRSRAELQRDGNLHAQWIFPWFDLTRTPSAP